MRAGDASEVGRILACRRSCRAFSARPIPAEDLDTIEAAIDSMPSLRGKRSGRAMLVRDPARASEIVSALTSGVIGKMNIWLARSDRPPACIVCAGDSRGGIVREGLHMYNVDAALAAEAGVIAAAALGIGSIWLAAIDERQVVRDMRLEPGMRACAVVMLGYARGGGIVDGMTQRLISGKRGPLRNIAFDDRFGNPLEIAPPDPTRRAGMIDLAGGPPPAEPLSVRIPEQCCRFEARPGRDQVRAMLDAARWAPNADNAQIGRWVVVSARERIEQILSASGVPEAGGAGEVTMLAACAAPAIIRHRTKEQPFALIDVPIAAVHAIAVAAASGLGWAFLPDIERSGAARALSLPGDHMAVGLLIVGRPAAGAPAGGGTGPGWLQLRRRG